MWKDEDLERLRGALTGAGWSAPDEGSEDDFLRSTVGKPEGVVLDFRKRLTAKSEDSLTLWLVVEGPGKFDEHDLPPTCRLTASRLSERGRERLVLGVLYHPQEDLSGQVHLLLRQVSDASVWVKNRPAGDYTGRKYTGHRGLVRCESTRFQIALDSRAAIDVAASLWKATHADEASGATGEATGEATDGAPGWIGGEASGERASLLGLVRGLTARVGALEAKVKALEARNPRDAM